MNSHFAQCKPMAFRPAPLLSNRHVQTIWPKYVLRQAKLAVVNERISTPDSDFLDLSWSVPETAKALVLVLHGLEGSINSHYVQDLFATLNRQNIASVLMHFRACSGQINLRARAYHSGETSDPLFVFDEIKNRYPRLPLFIVGYSLGGNVLLKLLAQRELDIYGAVAVSSPIDLASSAKAINRGFAKIYQHYLLTSMKNKFLHKIEQIRQEKGLEIHPDSLRSMKTVYEFDDQITAPLHGFENADDYYKRASAKPSLKKIANKTLILHSADDPFMDAAVIPSANELSSSIAYELSTHGGHCGFLQKKGNALSTFIPSRVMAFIKELL